MSDAFTPHEDPPYDEEDEYDDDEEDDSEPVGSCIECGCNLYIDDDLDEWMCDQCLWWNEQAAKDEK